MAHENNKPVWRFRLPDKIAGLSQFSLEENSAFWLEQARSWFYGYKTSKDYKATIWGKKVDFSFTIAPPGTPTERFPVSPAPKKKKRPVSLPPEQQAYVDQLQIKIKELKDRMPEPPDEAFEQRYWNHIDQQCFNGAMQRAIVAWNNTETDMPVRCREAGESLIGLLPALQAMQLPDELMRDDTRFIEELIKVLELAQLVEENAGKCAVEVSPRLHDLIVFVDELTDRMIEAGNRLRGLEREMTEDEFDACSDLEFDALYGCRSLEERLALLKELWENPLVAPSDRIEYLEKAIELVTLQARKRPEKIPCPYEELIKKHLQAIRGYVGELEDEGKDVWCRRMAEGLIDSLAEWRESAEMSPLSIEEFASRIYLQSLHIETKEQEDGSIHYQSELFFQDKDDSFDGHFMYARIEDHSVEEITLMG